MIPDARYLCGLHMCVGSSHYPDSSTHLPEYKYSVSVLMPHRETGSVATIYERYSLLQIQQEVKVI